MERALAMQRSGVWQCRQATLLLEVRSDIGRLPNFEHDADGLGAKGIAGGRTPRVSLHAEQSVESALNA